MQRCVISILVTAHSVTSNTLRDAHKLQKRSLALAPSGFL